MKHTEKRKVTKEVEITVKTLCDQCSKEAEGSGEGWFNILECDPADSEWVDLCSAKCLFDRMKYLVDNNLKSYSIEFEFEFDEMKMVLDYIDSLTPNKP